MTILRALTRSIENPTMPLSSSAIADFLNGVGAPGAPRVSEHSAMTMPAVWRAVNLLASTTGSLPLKSYRDDASPVRVAVLDNPHPDLTAFEVAELRMVHLQLWGNSYAQKLRNGAGQVAELWPLPPSAVKVGRRADLVTETNPTGKVFQLGDDDRAFTPADVLHVPGLGYDGICGVSPIRLARQAIGLGLAAEDYASKLYSSGSLMSGILQTEQRLEQPDADKLKANWKAKVTGLDKAHEIAVLDGGAKFQQISVPPADAQMIESRRFQISEVARWFGVPPHMLMDTEKSTSWGSGIEQQGIGFVVYTLRPWLTRIEQRLTREVTGRGIYTKHKVEGLLRGDSTARANFYNVMRNIGALNADEIRALEDMPAIPGGAGQSYLQPLNMAPLGSESNDTGTTGEDTTA